MTLKAIVDNSQNDLDRLYRLLYARGFLVEQDKGNGSISISDNAFDDSRARRYPTEASDWNDLTQALNGMICVEGDRIVSCTDQFSSQRVYDDLFTKQSRIGFETCWYKNDTPLNRFKQPGRFPAKPRTMELEAFVAMYVKAVSAIQLETILSCQGHPGEERGQKDLSVTFANCYCTAFHNALWATDSELGNIGLTWKTNGDKVSVKLTEDTAEGIYEKVIRAGQYIYGNRKDIRELRATVADKLTKEDEKLDGKEIEKRMIDLINGR